MPYLHLLNLYGSGRTEQEREELDVLSRSVLADVPQYLITPEQKRAVLQGEAVQLTREQKRISKSSRIL